MRARIHAGDVTEVPYTYVEADGEPVGDVVLAHGLAGDRNEVENLFEPAAERLSGAGFNSLRFDFRGNGASTVPHDRMTIRGEKLDLGRRWIRSEATASCLNT
jgi:alpha-beta hydrolase superfamily lysophospholipase